MTQNITIKPISKIKPKCKAIPGNGGESFHEEWGNLYISAKGYVTPCCWYGTQEHLTKLWKDSNLDKKLHNMHHYSIKEIIEGPIWKWIEDNMENIDVCNEKCVEENFDKHHLQ